MTDLSQLNNNYYDKHMHFWILKTSSQTHKFKTFYERTCYLC